MSILKKFDQLMSHLNGEDNSMAEEFRAELERCKKIQSFWNVSNLLAWIIGMGTMKLKR